MECRLYHLVKHIIHPIIHRYKILRCYFCSGKLIGHSHLPAHFFNLHGTVILCLIIYRTIAHIIAPVHIPRNDTEIQQIGQTIFDHRIDLIIGITLTILLQRATQYAHVIFCAAVPSTQFLIIAVRICFHLVLLRIIIKLEPTRIRSVIRHGVNVT